LEAFAAENGTALGGTERNGGLFSATRARGLGLHFGEAMSRAMHGGRTKNSDPLRFASLATLGFVLKLLVVKEKLFPGGENKITPTVNTLQHLVLKFH
jgi:hypothetical protein